jgi:hypothetical protein
VVDLLEAFLVASAADCGLGVEAIVGAKLTGLRLREGSTNYQLCLGGVTDKKRITTETAQPSIDLIAARRVAPGRPPRRHPSWLIRLAPSFEHTPRTRLCLTHRRFFQADCGQ